MAQEVPSGGVTNGEAVKEVAFASVKPRLYLEAPKANDAVQFYKAAFGAEEVKRVVHPKRKAEQEVPLIYSAELKIGSSSFLVSDFIADDSACLVKAASSGYVFFLETEDVEAAVEKAVNAGAVSEGVAVADCGGRVAKVEDPYGNAWLISATAKESTDVEA